MSSTTDHVFEIEMLSGPNDGEVVKFDVAEVSVGREKGSVLALMSDSVVSRKHAKIRYFDEDRITIEDLGSSFGTFVNGEKISGRRAVGQADIMCVGRTEFVCRPAAKGDAPAELTQMAEQTAT